MKLRFATIEDAEIISQIYAPFIQTTITFENTAPTTSDFQQRISQTMMQYPWIVIEDHQVQGYAYLSTFNTRTAYQHTADLSIYLSDSIKKKGYGRIMCEALFEIGKLQNICRIVSLVTSENLNSAAFHEKLGFKCQGRLQNVGYKHNKWLDVSFYVKDIQTINKPELMIPFSQLDKEKAQRVLDQFNQNELSTQSLSAK
ncbi:MAG: N-acetyltransferase [Erysipelotrichaceae bacterium]|nr:N-acetyltransferase [Erysipelotrichaceae bacterium]